MSETKAFILLFACGLLATLGSMLGLAALGSDGEAQAAAAVLCLVVMSFFVGAIGVHFGRRDDHHDR
jgi:hypothetical protein